LDFELVSDPSPLDTLSHFRHPTPHPLSPRPVCLFFFLSVFAGRSFLLFHPARLSFPPGFRVHCPLLTDSIGFPPPVTEPLAFPPGDFFPLLWCLPHHGSVPSFSLARRPEMCMENRLPPLLSHWLASDHPGVNFFSLGPSVVSSFGSIPQCFLTWLPTHREGNPCTLCFSFWEGLRNFIFPHRPRVPAPFLLSAFFCLTTRSPFSWSPPLYTTDKRPLLTGGMPLPVPVPTWTPQAACCHHLLVSFVSPASVRQDEL